MNALFEVSGAYKTSSNKTRHFIRRIITLSVTQIKYITKSKILIYTLTL